MNLNKSKSKFGHDPEGDYETFLIFEESDVLAEVTILQKRFGPPRLIVVIFGWMPDGGVEKWNAVGPIAFDALRRSRASNG